MGSGRFDYERCITGRCNCHAAPPKQPARGVALTLATYADPDGTIPPRFSPSLSGLAAASGFGRSTVVRALALLEDLGWLERDSPPIELARSQKVTTSYRLTVPSATAGLVPERDQSTSARAGLAGVTAGPELVPERDRASATAGHNHSFPTKPAAARAPEVARVAAILAVDDPDPIIDAWTRHRPELRNPLAVIARMPDDEIRRELGRHKPRPGAAPPCPDCNDEGLVYEQPDDPKADVIGRKCSHPRRAVA